MRITERVYIVGGSGYGLSAMGDCNVYLVDCGGVCALIDTGGGRGAEDILSNIERDGFERQSVEMVFITHSHYDHIGGNKQIKDATGCKIAAHKVEKGDIETLGELTLYEMAQASGLSFEPAVVDIELEDEQLHKVGDTIFKILHTPGHTPGGVSILTEEDGKTNLFSGDTASADGRMGFINGPGYDHDAWKESIKKLLSINPDRIFPGHGVFRVSKSIDALKALNRSWNVPWQVTAR
ncbi:MAG TPA: MBL fold metallo-hydrolase [Patescibacteria group bacterium]|nr:MBL fold metallo-hydrolase [Patescibacteria group bacterium]